MLRHREVERAPLEVSCREFGFTPESYRHLLETFSLRGHGGLFERKRGRRNPLKANDPVRKWLRHEHARDRSLGADELARLCHEQSGAGISRRTVYRVLADGGADAARRQRLARLRVMAFSAGAGGFSGAMSAGGKQRFRLASSKNFLSLAVG
ncbi:MAG: hypothetical protein ACREA0_00095 [bacterium]